MRKIGLYLTANFKVTILLTLLFAVFPLVGLPGAWISAVIIAFISLQMNAKSGLIVLICAAIPSLVFLLFGKPGLFMNVVVLQYLVVWVFACLLQRYRSWSFLLETAAILGIIIIICAHLFADDLPAWWSKQLMPYWQMLSQSVSFDITPDQSLRIIGLMSKIATGMLTAFLTATNLIIVLLARWWQVSLINTNAKVFSKELQRIRIGYTTGALLIICVLTSWFGINLSVDIMPVVALPFIISGLSLIHALVSSKAHAWMILIGVYVVLFLFFFYMILLLGILGFIDSWYDFRRRRKII